MNQEEGEAINAAFEKMAYKVISKAYYTGTGLSTPSKMYTEARAINKTITLDSMRQWFSENVEKRSR